MAGDDIEARSDEFRRRKIESILAQPPYELLRHVYRVGNSYWLNSDPTTQLGEDISIELFNALEDLGWLLTAMGVND